MNRKHPIDYKALYQQAQQQLGQRDAVIVLLQQQQMRMVEERQVHIHLIGEQDRLLEEGRQQLADLRQANAWQAETIVGLEIRQGQQQELLLRQFRLDRFILLH